MNTHPDHRKADNAGPFTLDGTRTYRIGRQRAVLVDPGPASEAHLQALEAWVGDAVEVRLLLTHAHPDHAAAARPLARRLGVPIYGPEGLEAVDRPLADGGVLETDEGTIRAVSTDGHARPHFSYHWEARGALFVGDLLLGVGDTTWVGEYPGCVADYLASLERVRRLGPTVLYPAHGPPIEDVSGALARYRRHRLERIRQVQAALAEQPDMTVEALMTEVYGPQLPEGVSGAARASLTALVEYVRESGRGEPTTPT